MAEPGSMRWSRLSWLNPAPPLMAEPGPMLWSCRPS